MRNFTIYLAVLACLFFNSMRAQQTFEDRAKAISEKIEAITAEEKASLKTAVEAINNQLVEGEISREEADSRKRKLAEASAIAIESKVALAEEELKALVQDKVDGKIRESDSKETFSKISWQWRTKRDSIRKYRSERRTTTQFVFAAGLNNVMANDQVANSDYRYWGSHFYEWGFTYNSRLSKNHNLLHLKYGLSLMYNNLRPTNNRVFEDAGQETALVVSPINLRDSRFRNVNLVVPVHLEFDFSKNRYVDGDRIFRTHRVFRMGIGGFAGLNVKSKQVLKYEVDGEKTRQITKGDFNVNDFVYGVSSYIGYKETSIYLKYDLNPIFRNNAVKENNISLGLRFDLN